MWVPAVDLEGAGLRGAAIGVAVAGAALHDESGAVIVDVGNYGLAAVQPHRVIEANSEHEVYYGSGRESEGIQLQEDPHGREIPGTAATKASAGHRKINGGGHLTSFKQTTFQWPAPPLGINMPSTT